MEFDNSFTVPLPPAEAWTLLMDIQRIAPCMPGAELTEVVDSQTYKGKISVRLGPVALTFAGVVKFEEIDEAAHTARIKAQGTDAKGRGGANATASFRLAPVPEGTQVLVHTDLALSGNVAQYGRGVGVVQTTAAQLMNQFATALKAQLAQQQAAAVAAAPAAPAADTGGTVSSAPPPPPPAAAKPISGFSLLARVLWESVKGLFGGRKA